MLQEKEIAKAVNLISENPQIITIETDRRIFGNHDDRIIDVAKTIVKDYNCKIHIITNDKGFKAKQKLIPIFLLLGCLNLCRDGIAFRI